MTILNWAQNRQFPLTELANGSALHDAWNLSQQIIAELRAVIVSETVPSEIRCIAISGSIARMEAHQQSDMDVLIVLNDGASKVSTSTAEHCHTETWRRLLLSPSGSGLKRPKPGGVFSQCVSSRAVTNVNSRGIVNEDVTAYGQRMQLLMDAQPLYADESFSQLQGEILEWYSETRVARLFDEDGRFHWLWQDVQRYWRSIRSRNCWADADTPLKSYEVNLKLRSSRIVMIAAFLSAIRHAHTSDSGETAAHAMIRQLRHTPLERLASVINTPSMKHLLECYETVWQYTATLSEMPPRVPEHILAAIAGIKTSLTDLPDGDSNWSF